MAVDTSLLSREFAQSRKLVGADFSIYTGSMKTAGLIPIPDADRSRPIVQMRGSSTIMDLQGDIMALSALEDMTHLDPDFLIFSDHSYNLDNIMGKLYGQPMIQLQNHIADLWLATEMAVDHPPAERAYNLIVKSKLRLGTSVGCLVLEWDFADPNDPNSPIIIKRVQAVEFSIVSLPANQRCWVENAIKGRFARSLVDGDAETAKQLAPAFKSLFSRDYASIVDNITSDGLKSDLSRIKARGTQTARVMYTLDGEEGFYLDAGTGTKKSLSREEVSTLLAQRSVAQKAAPLQDDAPMNTVQHSLDEDDLDSTKAATGKTSWPLMAIGTEWTGSRAEKDIFAWAKNEDGEIVASKARQCFLWYDPDNADKQSGFKMPFCYIVDGSPKIVPLGCRACAGVLSGGMGGGKFGGDDAAMKAKVKTLYGRINREFSPDPKWEVPWEKEDKSLDALYDGENACMRALGFETEEQNGMLYVKESSGGWVPWLTGKAEGVLDTESGQALIRQDIVEDTGEAMKDKAGGVAVSADGSHEPFSGRHSHAHKAYGTQGGDDLHTHEHSHDNDAHHGHAHAEKSVTAGCGCCAACTGKADCACCAACTARKAIALDEDGNHHPFTGTHTHEHKAFGADDAEDGMHSHAHAHDGDSTHKHPHEDAADGRGKSLTPANAGPTTMQEVALTGKAVPELTDIQKAALRLYNDIGKSLGLLEVSEAMLATKCNLVQSPEQADIVRSLLSQLDDVSDALIGMAQKNDGYVDSLMALMGVPDSNDGDDDDDDDGDDAPAPYGLYSMDAHGLSTKEGRELSGKNLKLLQGIHDAVKAMHPDACAGVSGDGTAHQGDGTTVEEAQAQARMMGEGPDYSMLASAEMSNAIKAAIQQTFAGVSAAEIITANVTKAVDSAMGEARMKLAGVQNEVRATLEAVGKLKDMPLGRPTGFSRTVMPVSSMAIDNIASVEELLSVGGEGKTYSLDEMEKLTRIVSKQVYTTHGPAIARYRLWPVGVAKGQRPPLSAEQKVAMHDMDAWEAYETASRDVLIPLIDDPFIGE